MRAAPILLAFSLCASAAIAQGQAPLTPGDVMLELDHAPRPAAPAGAARPGAPAQVGAVCRIQADGRLVNCAVMEERPAGYGLGAWLLQLFAHARVASTARDGSPTAGRLFAFRTVVRADGPAGAASAPKT